MGRYDRRYDFGMRGYGQTTRPLEPNRGHPAGYDRSFGSSYPGARQSYPRTPRVTVSYNRDYVDGDWNRYDRGFRFGEGRSLNRTGDESLYRHPYWTVSGTRTLRGTVGPAWYDAGYFRRPYQGRYDSGF